MNIATLQQKLTVLQSFPRLDSEEIQRFGKILRGLSDWELFRIDPLHFAKNHQFDPAVALELFIHAAKIGLLDLEYLMFCPACGGNEYAHASLNNVQQDIFHCSTCNNDLRSGLDDTVMVAFTVNPAIAEIHIDPYASFQNYQRFFFSSTLERSAPLRALMQQNYRGFIVVDPDDETRFAFEAEPGQFYRALSMELHSALYLKVDEQPSQLPQVVDIDLVTSGFAPQQMKIAAGPTTLLIHNRAKSRVGASFFKINLAERDRILSEHPNVVHPYLTGKQLLNHQSFRDLFRIQNLAPGLKLNIRNLTILFTDLKNSTEMYGKAGDAFAYGIVQQHFNRLIEIVRRNEGSMVKTMGDAIMATFSTPQDGILAAMQMMEDVEAQNRGNEKLEYPLHLKLGIHTGPALAVNADERLDYFGQSVNIAARVQGLAQAEEIWLTENMMEYPGIANALGKQGYQVNRQSAYLKGLQTPMVVYQCQRQT